MFLLNFDVQERISKLPDHSVRGFKKIPANDAGSASQQRTLIFLNKQL